jgi:transglutaminase-like putative cysteine protease
MRAVFAGLLCLLLCCAGGVEAKPETYKTAAAPAWVVPVSAIHAPAATPQPTRGSVAYVLRDMQTRIDQRGKVTYFHSASRALDGGGVEKMANVSINFDPSYQALTLHAINVIRDGVVIPKLPGARVHVLQRETELDYLVYDGSMTASVLLDDIRIGDMVEYAFSLDGVNSVFQGKISGRAEMEWAVPVEHSFLRLLTPSNRPLRIAARNTRLEPRLTEAGGYRDYRWEQHNIPALKVDQGAPEWFDPYASVQWTEFADWAAVVQWALPLYQPARKQEAPLRQEIERIAREHPDAAGRVAAVLKLVQRDIRYLGIEVGPGSHAPTAPDKVYQRRFGDCKDKTLLAVTMLQALGIDAVPALVNTGIGREVLNWAATPTAFNHVLVRVLVDGKLYWLDPTRPLQQGDLAHLYQPDYGYALVLAPDSKALTLMGQHSTAHKVVRAVFDSTAGADKPVDYTISTTVHGQSADNLRRELANNRADMVTQYSNFYARSYPDIRANGGLGIQDDTVRNALTVVEPYCIPGFWALDKNGQRRKAHIEASEIEAPLKAPDAVGRNAPLRIDYPYEVTESTEVLLPHRWGITTSDVQVRDPAFEFTYKVSKGPDAKSVLISAHYKALKGHVEPGDMGNYVAHLKQARDAVGYSLSTGVTEAAAAEEADAEQAVSGGMAMRMLGVALPVMVMIALLIGWSWLGTRMQRSPPAHAQVNKRLLLVVVVVSGLAAMSAMPHMRLAMFLPPALVVLAVTMQYLWRTVPQVPASHITYQWALRFYRARGQTTPLVLRALLRKVPPLIGWFAIGTVLAKLFK